MSRHVISKIGLFLAVLDSPLSSLSPPTSYRLAAYFPSTLTLFFTNEQCWATTHSVSHAFQALLYRRLNEPPSAPARDALSRGTLPQAAFSLRTLTFSIFCSYRYPALMNRSAHTVPTKKIGSVILCDGLARRYGRLRKTCSR